jgi:hypothetical protein
MINIKSTFMKKLLKLMLAGTFVAAGFVMNPLKAQTTQTATDSLKTIPADVMTIFKKSCFDCHTEPGRIMPLEHLNFTKWADYTAEKQAEKANAICNEITKAKMPPKKFVEKNPDAVPTQDELKIICDWAKRMSDEK